MCVIRYPYVSHDLLMHASWLMCTCHRTHLYVWHIGTKNASLPRRPHMWWLWSVGSIKLWVSFAKEPYKRDNVLQKRPIILSILLIKATPYVCHGASIRVTWLIHMCDMTCTQMCAMTHPHMLLDSLMYATWLICTCDNTHSYVWHDT